MSEKEIYLEELVANNGRKIYKCLICDRTITTKYSAKYHLHSAHGLSPVKRLKRRNSTEANYGNVLIPRQTKHNWKKKNEDNEDGQHSTPEPGPESNIGHEFEAAGIDLEHESSPADVGAQSYSHEDMSLPSGDYTEPGEDSHGMDYRSSQEHSESSSDDDASLTLSSISDSSDYCFESDEDIVENDEQQDTSILDKQTSILSCFIRNNFSVSSCKDVLSTFKTICSDSISLSQISYQSIWEQMDSHYSKEIHYCEDCGEIFSENLDITNCQYEGCNGSRYRDALSRIPCAKFVFANIQKQLQNLLSSPGIWEDIQKSKRLATERHVEKPNIITDITDGSLYWQLMGPDGFLGGRNKTYNLTLLFNTDGVNLYSSSKVQLWPLFMAINELSPRARFARDNVILAGIWQGKGKPPFKQFLSTFSAEMNRLYDHGFPLQLNGKEVTIKVSVVCGTFDLPAKACVLNMTQYNGKECCITCEDPAQTVKQGKGHALHFPHRELEDKFPKRTTEDVIDCMQNSSDKHKKKGFKGVSGIATMKGLDLVNGMPPDYMHCVLLGVTKNLLYKWFSPTESGQTYFIGKRLKEISKRLKNIQPPESMERLPRDLEKNFNNFKATELQAWLLYYGLPCLSGILDDIYLEHFAKLSEGVYLLLGDHITTEDLQRSEKHLDTFFKKYAELYSAGSCGLNVHNIGAHLVYYVKTLGPLWAWSCFAFEDCNSMITKAVHGTGDVTNQIMKLKQAQTLLRNSEMKIPLKMNLKPAVNCEIKGAISLLTGDQFTDTIFQYFNGEVELKHLRKVNRISLHGKTFYSKGYTRMKKRICYTVMRKDGGAVVVNYFVLNQNDRKVYAVATDIIQANTGLSNLDSGKHLIAVQIGQDCALFPADELVENLWVIKIEQDTYIAQMPNTHGHAIFK